MIEFEDPLHDILSDKMPIPSGKVIEGLKKLGNKGGEKYSKLVDKVIDTIFKE